MDEWISLLLTRVLQSLHTINITDHITVNTVAHFQTKSLLHVAVHSVYPYCHFALSTTVKCNHSLWRYLKKLDKGENQRAFMIIHGLEVWKITCRVYPGSHWKDTTLFIWRRSPTLMPFIGTTGSGQLVRDTAEGIREQNFEYSWFLIIVQKHIL